MAVDQEDARTLTDVIFRRLAAGFDPGLDALTTATGELLVRERGWSRAQIEADTEQIDRLAARMGMREQARR